MNRLRASGAPFAGRVLAAVLLFANSLHGQDFAPVDALVAKGELASAASALSEMASKDPKAAKDPKAKALWMRLGDGHYQKKAFREAADAYAKAAEISVDARSPFNAACGYALAGDTDKAFTWLEKAVATAAYPPASIEADGDLASLRKDPRWTPLLEKARLAVEPCRAVPELLQFDFWLGEWNVRPNGAQAYIAESRIEKVLAGCVVVETWMPQRAAGSGRSFNTYDPARKQWRQVWVSQTGARVDFDGALVAEGQMRLVAAKDAQGNLSRMTFTRETPDRVKQHGESSADDGKTWTTTFDFLYERKAPVIAKAEAVLELPRRDVLAEGVAFDPASGAYFVSAVHARSIYRATPSGEVTLFSKKDDGLLGVFGMAVDPKTKSLWAATSGLPEMQGYTPADDDRAFVAQYDLKTGKLVRKVGVPKDGKKHVLGDVILLPSGELLATDSAANVVYRVPAKGGVLEVYAGPGPLRSLQGLAPSPDGKTLFLADWSQGLFRLDPETKSIEKMKGPEGTNLRGIDGLYASKGALLGVQNGTITHRILKISLTPTGDASRVEILEAGNPEWAEPTLGVLVDGAFVYNARSQWGLFENGAVGKNRAKLRPPLLMKLALE